MRTGCDRVARRFPRTALVTFGPLFGPYPPPVLAFCCYCCVLRVLGCIGIGQGGLYIDHLLLFVGVDKARGGLINQSQSHKALRAKTDRKTSISWSPMRLFAATTTPNGVPLTGRPQRNPQRAFSLQKRLFWVGLMRFQRQF